jgi:hypothetical protein
MNLMKIVRNLCLKDWSLKVDEGLDFEFEG